jgi:hypothetical protein
MNKLRVFPKVVEKCSNWGKVENYVDTFPMPLPPFSPHSMCKCVYVGENGEPKSRCGQVIAVVTILDTILQNRILLCAASILVALTFGSEALECRDYPHVIPFFTYFSPFHHEYKYEYEHAS